MRPPCREVPLDAVGQVDGEADVARLVADELGEGDRTGALLRTSRRLRRVAITNRTLMDPDAALGSQTIWMIIVVDLVTESKKSFEALIDQRSPRSPTPSRYETASRPRPAPGHRLTTVRSRLLS